MLLYSCTDKQHVYLVGNDFNIVHGNMLTLILTLLLIE